MQYYHAIPNFSILMKLKIKDYHKIKIGKS